MKIKMLGTITAALLLTSGIAQAAHVWEDPGGWWSGHWYVAHDATPKFTDQELSLDLFGSFVSNERRAEDIFKTNIRHGHWGGGVGVNYFFVREFGVSGDINISDNRGNFIDQATGNLVARLPIESAGLAPYIFGGGGRSFDPEWEWLGDAGVGIEWRPNPATGIFVDARYEWLDKTADRLLLRGGLRLVF
jgi:hypothetical protein